MVSVLVTFLIAETKDKSTIRGEAFLRFTAAQWRTHELPPAPGDWPCRTHSQNVGVQLITLSILAYDPMGWHCPCPLLGSVFPLQ